MPKTNHCLVLDLDETLIHTFDEFKNYEKLQLYSSSKNSDLREYLYVIDIDASGVPGEGKRLKLWGAFRPALLDFLKFAVDYFEEIHVWSAGQFNYVHSIVEVIFHNNDIPVEKIFTYEDTVFDKHKNTIKELNKLLKHAEKAHEKNTFIVDDRDDTLVNKKNVILIPKYKPSENRKGILTDDDALERLMKWFNKPEVINSKDVQKLDKTKIFD